MRQLQRINRNLAVWGMPLMGGLVVLGPFLFRAIYPAKFHGAAVIFGVLGVRLMTRVLSLMQFQYLMASGEVYLATRGYVAAVVALAASYYPLTEAFGIIGIAYAMAFSTTCLSMGMTMVFVWRRELSLVLFVISIAWSALALAAVLLTN